MPFTQHKVEIFKNGHYNIVFPKKRTGGDDLSSSFVMKKSATTSILQYC